MIKINKAKSWFFEKINKIEKPLARLIKKKREKNQFNKIRSEKWEVTSDIAEIQRIVWDYYIIFSVNHNRKLTESKCRHDAPSLINTVVQCIFPKKGTFSYITTVQLSKSEKSTFIQSFTVDYSTDPIQFLQMSISFRHEPFLISFKFKNKFLIAEKLWMIEICCNLLANFASYQ